MHTDTYCLEQRQSYREFIEATWFSLVNLHGCVCAGSPSEQGNNPQGASDLHGSQAVRAGAPSGLMFTVASVGVMDMSPHHIMQSWFLMGPSTPLDLGSLMARPMEREVSNVKVAKQISEQVWNPEQSFPVSSGNWPENKQHKTSYPINFRVRISDLHYLKCCLK